MDGLARVAGGSSQITVGGKEYRISPLTLGDFADLEQILLQRRGDPLRSMKEIVKDMPENVQFRLMHEAYLERRQDLYVSLDEAMQYLMTPDGLHHALLFCLRKNHPEINTVEAVKEVTKVISVSDIDALQKLISSLAAIDDLGNSNGSPTPDKAETTGQTSN